MSLRERCLAYDHVMSPASAFSHVTAAQLHGLPVPLAVEGSHLLDVSGPTRASTAAGIRGHQVRFTAGDVDTRFRMRVTTPERTLCDLAASLTLRELVAVADHLLAPQAPLANPQSMRACLARYPGRRGLRTLTRAIELADGLAESPRESYLRVLLIEAGLPRPTLQLDVFDQAGRFVARVDLAYRHSKIAIEYEGDHHRTSTAQWRRDIRRIRKLQRLGWQVARVSEDDLLDPTELLLQLRYWLATRPGPATSR